MWTKRAFKVKWKTFSIIFKGFLGWQSKTWECVFKNITTVKSLNSGHLRVLKNLSVIERCPLLGGNLKKIVTFGTKCFVRYSWHVRYLGCPLLGGFTVVKIGIVSKLQCIVFPIIKTSNFGLRLQVYNSWP